MPLAIGGSSVPGKLPHGALWVDVRDYGAKADNGVTDNAVPFQSAIDDLASKLAGSPSAKGVVFIPSAPQVYGVKSTVWVDHDNVEIQGEGWGSCVQMMGSKHSVFLFGVRRTETDNSGNPLVIDGSNRPDCFGKLDASAAASPGSKWGLRTNGNTFAQFQACPLSAGAGSSASVSYSDNWSETSKLTVEFCIEPPDGQQFPLNVPLLGMGDLQSSEVSPFTLWNWYAPGKLLFAFRTSDMEPGPHRPIRQFAFSLGSATPPFRVAVQVDLDNAVCTAFVNGVQVAITEPTNLDPTAAIPFTPHTGMRFATNGHYPFMIGAGGLFGPLGLPTGVDLRVYGLRISNAIRYRNNGVGQTQARADAPATPVNDAWSYFGYDANTIGYLTCADPPSASRVITVQGGGATVGSVSSGLFLNSTSNHHVAQNAIRDLQIICSTGYGQAVGLGAVVEMTVEGVRTLGGYHGVGQFNMGVNYFVYLTKCNLEGLDSGYFGVMQLMYGRDIVFNSAGRVTVRHVGCGARWDNVLVANDSPVVECVFKAVGYDYGGAFMLSNWVVDFEGATLSQAAIYCEAHAQTPSTSLNLTNIFLGTVGATASLVQLKDTAPYNQPGLHPCWLSVDNLQAYTTAYAGAFDVDGARWAGEVKGVALVGTRLYHRQRWGTQTRLVVYEATLVAPPRELYWYNGAHVLQVRSPADGQYAEWRCMGTGTYGTPTPPVWVGVNPLLVSGNGLAAYVLNLGYITAALS